MTGKQNAVMWMGLILVAANLFLSKEWQALWNGTILMGNNANSQKAKNQLTQPNPLGNPGGGGYWWFPYMNSTSTTPPSTQPTSPSAAQLSA